MRKLFPSNTFVEPQLPSGRDLNRLMIGEAPGKEEAEGGIPFIGGCGKWLNSMLAKAGIPRSGLTIINTIQCRPKDNIFPTSSEARSYISKDAAVASVHQCVRNHVLPILRSRKWSRVDLLGDVALRFIGGKFGIHKWRGSPVEIDTDEIERRVS